MAENKPQAPRVNFNGTCGRDLIDQQRAIADAAYDLITILCEARPHGRDYQMSPAGDYDRARKEHEMSIKAAQGIRTRAVDLSFAISNQERI